MKWRERLGIRPTTITVATEGFSSAFYTTSFGLEAPTPLHRQRAPLEEYYFQGNEFFIKLAFAYYATACDRTGKKPQATYVTA